MLEEQGHENYNLTEVRSLVVIQSLRVLVDDIGGYLIQERTIVGNNQNRTGV